jgi:hypothetical protein
LKSAIELGDDALVGGVAHGQVECETIRLLWPRCK